MIHTHRWGKTSDGDIYKFCARKGCKKRKKIVLKPKQKNLKNKCDEQWALITKKIHVKRFGKVCGWCKKPSDELQSDHIINRWKMATRWNVRNCIVLDKVCHLFRKKREPFAWAEAVREYAGDDVLEDLKIQAQEIIKPDYEAIMVYLNTMDNSIDTMEFDGPKPLFDKLYPPDHDDGPMEQIEEARSGGIHSPMKGPAGRLK